MSPRTRGGAASRSTASSTLASVSPCTRGERQTAGARARTPEPRSCARRRVRDTAGPGLTQTIDADDVRVDPTGLDVNVRSRDEGTLTSSTPVDDRVPPPGPRPGEINRLDSARQHGERLPTPDALLPVSPASTTTRRPRMYMRPHAPGGDDYHPARSPAVRPLMTSRRAGRNEIITASRPVVVLEDRRPSHRPRRHGRGDGSGVRGGAVRKHRSDRAGAPRGSVRAADGGPRAHGVRPVRRSGGQCGADRGAALPLSGAVGTAQPDLLRGAHSHSGAGCGISAIFDDDSDPVLY